ncbi:UDP-N-acetylglucosamine 4,6-dehydratase (inverting) [bacterium]|nr:UDP-N-acetylglucosamine 4,6-dehydratase (inverting) [bacterium]
MPFTNKVILVTGGTGSFGKKFTQIVLKEHNPKAIRIFSRGELKQQQVREQFQQFPNSEKLRFFIGDVRDRDRLHRAMDGVDIVIHAAALKQVPTCEYNPIEAVKTNIDGAANVIDAAIDNNVEKVMALSTDKAVHPVNLYGATKLVAEKLFIQGNTYSGKRKTKFSCVRYGNVMASRGSVIHIFQEQRKNGTITITDQDMTRFWITQRQTVRFITNCIEKMKGGEIFVPKIPSMKIIDLAQAIAPRSKIKITGIRPGEKIDEVLLTGEEARHAKEFDKYFVVEPEYAFWNKNNFKDGKSLTSNFVYSSSNNDHWITKAELNKMLEEL